MVPTALIKGDEALDYDSLSDRLCRVAAAFVEIGIKADDRVAVYLNKCMEMVISYFAASYAGAVFVPVNASLKPAQAQHILSDCGIVALITTAAQAEAINRGVGGLHSSSALDHL